MTAPNDEDAREPIERSDLRRHGRDPQGQQEQVRGGSRDRPDPAGPDAVHLDRLPGRLRLHRGHPRPGRRSARRPGAGLRADLPGLPDQVPGDRHVPDDRRGRRRRQGALRAGLRPPPRPPARHRPTSATICCWRSSTSSPSTRTSSPASPSRARPGPAPKRPRTRCAPASSGRRTTTTTELSPPRLLRFAPTRARALARPSSGLMKRRACFTRPSCRTGTRGPGEG